MCKYNMICSGTIIWILCLRIPLKTSRQTYEYVYCPIINSAFINMVFRGCLVVHTSGILYTALVEVHVVGLLIVASDKHNRMRSRP